MTFSEGTFWMRFEDWIVNFNKVYVCRTFNSDWTSFKLEGTFAQTEYSVLQKISDSCDRIKCDTNLTWSENPQYLIQC